MQNVIVLHILLFAFLAQNVVGELGKTRQDGKDDSTQKEPKKKLHCTTIGGKTMMTEFSQAVCEKIGYYVYALKDPRTNTVFYIGKGVSNRIFQHILGALETSTKSDKLDLIREIGAENVQHFIIRHGLTEEQAFELEGACIDLLGLENLTNVVKGHDSWERGLKTVDEIMQYYDAEAVTITEPTIIIKINRDFKRSMSAADLYQVTRCAWKISADRRAKTKYAIAAYRGIVREVYQIHNWKKSKYPNRWEFTGEVAEDSIRAKYLNQSLEKYIKKGSQNPIQYAGFKE